MGRTPDIELLIGAKGGYSAGGESAKLIASQLSSQIGNGIEIKINTQSIVNQIKTALKNASFNINVKNTGTTSNSVSKNQTGTGTTTNSKNAVADFDREYQKLEASITKAYSAAKSFGTYINSLSPDSLKAFSSEINKVQAAYEKAIKSGKTSDTTAANLLAKELQYQINYLSQTTSAKKENEKFNKEYASLANNISRAYNSMRSFNSVVASLDSSALNLFKTDIASITSLLDKAALSGDVQALQNANLKIQELRLNLDKLNRQKSASVAAEKASANAYSELARFQKYLQTVNPKGLEKYAAQITQIQNILNQAISNNNAVANLSNARKQIQQLKSDFSSLGYTGGNAFTYLEQKIKGFAVYLMSSAITMRFISGIRNMISTVKELDAALIDLRIVTRGTAAEAQELLNTYNQMAQELGSTTVDVANAAVEWQRQGFSIEETNTLLKDSMILSITGFIDSTEAATALTAAMKGYQVSVEDALSIVDKFVATDQVAATSAGDLAIALSKTAANAKLAGLSLDEVVGQLAVVNEVMQEAPESTGTFYNTMLSRIGMIKAGRLSDPETGESLSDVETTLNAMGIKLRDSYSEFRNFSDVLNEVGQSWDNYSSVQQRAIATAFAGTRQQTRFLSLMSNWNTALKYTSVAAESAGTATEKFSAYEEGLEAKTNRATAAFEKMSQAIIPSGVIGAFLDFGTNVFNLGSALGGLPITITAVVSSIILLRSAIKAIETSKFGVSIANTTASLKGLAASLSSAGIASTAFSAAQSGSAVSTTALSAAFSVLTPTQIANLAVQNQLEEGQLKSILTRAKVKADIQETIILQYQETTATLAASTAQREAAASTIGLSNALNGLKTVIKTHPIMFLVSALIAVVAITTSIVKAQEKHFQELQKEFQDIQNGIEELNSELETTQNKIKELEDADTLSFVEQEELDRLKTYNQYLKDRIYLENYVAIEKAKEINSDVANEYDRQKNTYLTFYDREKAERGEVPSVVLSYEDYYQAAIEQYKKDQEEIYSIQKQMAAQSNSLSLEEKQALQNRINVLEEDAEAYKQAIVNMSQGFSEQQQLLQDVNGDYGEYNELYEHLIELVSMGANALRDGGLTEAVSDINEVLNDTKFSSVKQNLLSLASQGKLTADVLKDKAYEDFIDELEKLGIVSKDSEDGFEIVISALIRIAQESSDAEEEIADLETAISNFGDATDKIEKIYSLIDELKNSASEKLSASFLNELYELFPELAGTIFTVEDANKALQNGLIETEDVAKRAYGQMLLSNAEWVQNAINNSSKLQSSLAVYYKNDLTNWKKSAEAKWIVDKNLVSDLSNLWAKYLNYSDMALQSQIDKIDDIIFSGPGWASVSEEQLNEYWAMKAILDMRKSVASAMETIDFTPVDSLSQSASSGKTAIEEYVVEIDRLREALKRVSDIEDDIDVEEIKFDMIDEDDINAQTAAINTLISLYKAEQDAMHELNNERDDIIQEIADELNKYGLGASYDSQSNEFWVSNLEKINEVSAKINGKFDQEATNELREYLEELISKAEEYAEANIEGSTEWWNIQKKIYDLNKQILETEEKIQEERLESMQKSRDLLDELVELEKDRIKQAGEDLIDSLEAEIDAYDEIISRQKESLELREREKDYKEEVSDAVDEIAKLQAKADALALDDSRSAQLQRAEILEQIAEKQKELNDTQHDYAIENTEDALDAELEKFEKTQQDKIDAIEDFLDDQEKLTNLAYKNIQQGGQETFNKLLEYCKHYTDVSEIELTRMWDNAIAKIKEYGSLVSAISSMDTIIDVSENGHTDEAQSIIDQMKANSAKWKTASSEEEKERLVAENDKLEKELERLLQVEIVLNGKDGRRHYGSLDGPYVYHTGGVVGGNSTVKQNEMMILAEKGEMMLTKKQQDNIASILTSKINRPEPQSLIKSFMAKIGELGGSQNITVDASVRVEGGMVDDAVIGTIERNQRKIANIVTKLLLKN